MNALPVPAHVSAWSSAWWARAIPSTVASPVPRPLALVLKKGSKMRSMVRLSIPGPSSVTERKA